jgi:hypothetical protein
MNTENKNILNFITAVRESFGGSIAVYTMGNCYQFYEILKTIFPDAEAYESGGHVWTKIDGKFYDIRGEAKQDFTFIPVLNDRIESLTKNKYTDERRKNMPLIWENFKKNKS